MTSNTTPLTPEREQEIRDSIPTVYGPPWTVHPDMDGDVWRVLYATDNPLAGLVCEVPDYGAHLAEFIAEARAAVPELLAEIDRLRAVLDAEKSAHLFTLRQRNNRSKRLMLLHDLALAGDVKALQAAAKDTLAASIADHIACAVPAGVESE